MKILLNLLLLFLVYNSLEITMHAQTQTPDVTIDLIVNDNIDKIRDLSFGLDNLATDGIDQFLGELELPPVPVPGAWDVRLILPPNNWLGLASWKDYRNETNFPYTGQREYRIQYQLHDDSDTIFFKWDFPPEVTGVLQDLIVGTIVNQPMHGSGSFYLVRGGTPDPLILNQLKMTISYNNIIAGFNEVSEYPSDFILEQNYPNPFNPSTAINFSLPVSSDISLRVFNILGKEVADITKGFYSAGNHSVVFDAKGLATGVYIYQLKHQSGMISKKMTLIK